MRKRVPRVLTQYVAFLGGAMSSATTLANDARTEGVEYFDADQCLLNTFRRATANGQDIHLAVDGLGEVVMLSKRGEYFAELADPEAFFTSDPNNARLSVLAEGDSRIPPTTTIGRNIDELIWQAAFHASQGRLMPGCYRDDVVELELWPNLSRLPHTPQSMRIAALLSRHPTSIFFASRLLKVSAAEMYQFYSAAHAAGFARPINRTPEEPQLKPHRNQTLLSALLGKIARL